MRELSDFVEERIGDELFFVHQFELLLCGACELFLFLFMLRAQIVA
jgi:hypothetical protein